VASRQYPSGNFRPAWSEELIANVTIDAEADAANGYILTHGRMAKRVRFP
jgi:hypothetical protein